MGKVYKLSVRIIFVFISWHATIAQCTGGSNAGSITPSTTWNTTCIQGGRYLTFVAQQGMTYEFSFCLGGGNAPTWDTQITIMDSFGTLTTEGYNDDYCGQGSHIVFLAPTTGTYRVYVTKFTCLSDATCQTLAYRISFPKNDNICNAVYLYSNSCSCKYQPFRTSYATDSPQLSPGCGAYNGDDVWFSTKVPSSGSIEVSTNSGTITDGAFAVYKGSSCGSALTFLGCDDDSGPGYMPQLNLSGLTPGDTLFIRFWTYGNAESGTFGICLRDPQPFYCMEGQASESNFSGQCITVTPNKIGQIGCVWNTTQIDMNQTFDYTLYVNLGSNNGNGADGMAFVLQNSPQGITACGNPGYQLGIGPVSNTLIVEFDTFDNGAVASDIASDHIAINVNGDLSSPVAGPIQASSTSTNIEDGVNHAVRITWNPASQIFNVYFDGIFRLSYTSNIIANVFGGNPNVFWGVTASTGFYTNSQSICPGTLPGSPLPVLFGTFDTYLINGEARLIWNTYSEDGSKEFQIEKSFNGMSFNVIGSVSANGYSDVISSYSFVDKDVQTGDIYYRLKQIDLNDEYFYSEIKKITINNAAKSDIVEVFPNPIIDGAASIDAGEEGTLEIYDNTLVLIHTQQCSQGINNLSLEFRNGLYNAVYHTRNGSFSFKIVVSR